MDNQGEYSMDNQGEYPIDICFYIDNPAADAIGQKIDI